MNLNHDSGETKGYAVRRRAARALNILLYVFYALTVFFVYSSGFRNVLGVMRPAGDGAKLFLLGMGFYTAVLLRRRYRAWRVKAGPRALKQYLVSVGRCSLYMSLLYLPLLPDYISDSGGKWDSESMIVWGVLMVMMGAVLAGLGMLFDALLDAFSAGSRRKMKESGAGTEVKSGVSGQPGASSALPGNRTGIPTGKPVSGPAPGSSTVQTSAPGMKNTEPAAPDPEDWARVERWWIPPEVESVRHDPGRPGSVNENAEPVNADAGRGISEREAGRFSDGSAADGSVAGSSTAGDSAAGESVAGSSTAGGSAADGSTAGSSAGVSGNDLQRQLEKVQQTLEPHGETLGTLEGQRALFEEAQAVLPVIAVLRSIPPLAAFLYDEKTAQAQLPDLVGKLLEGIGGVIGETDLESLYILWLDLPPEALVRGWRALSAYRRISSMQYVFEDILESLEAQMTEREDVLDWLALRCGREI